MVILDSQDPRGTEHLREKTTDHRRVNWVVWGVYWWPRFRYRMENTRTEQEKNDIVEIERNWREKVVLDIEKPIRPTPCWAW